MNRARIYTKPTEGPDKQSSNPLASASLGRWAGLTAVGLTALAFNGPVEADEKGAATKEPTPNKRTIVHPKLATLENLRCLSSCNFSETPVREVLQHVAEEGRVSIQVLWVQDNRPDGIDPERTFSLKAKELSLQHVVDLLTKSLSTEGREVTWQLSDEGVLQIGSKVDLNRYDYAKIYNVHDLVLRLPQITNTPKISLSTSSENIFENSSRPGSSEPKENEGVSAEDLGDVITKVIEYDQWRRNGGTGARLSVFKESLVVSAPDYVHRQIGGYP